MNIYKTAYSLCTTISFGRVGSKLRLFFIGRCLQHKSSNIYIGKNVRIVAPEKLSIGKNVSIHEGCYIDASGGVFIGDDVAIAHDCSILSFNHTWDKPLYPIQKNPLRYGTVTIENDCWIGCKAIILPNITISHRCIVAAGAVVTKSFNANVILGGNPAKIIKQI